MQLGHVPGRSLPLVHVRFFRVSLAWAVELVMTDLPWTMACSLASLMLLHFHHNMHHNLLYHPQFNLHTNPRSSVAMMETVKGNS